MRVCVRRCRFLIPPSGSEAYRRGADYALRRRPSHSGPLTRPRSRPRPKASIDLPERWDFVFVAGAVAIGIVIVVEGVRRPRRRVGP